MTSVPPTTFPFKSRGRCRNLLQTVCSITSITYFTFLPQRTLSVEEIRTIDKHPAFKLILDFVTNDSYSHER